ncbi:MULTISPECIES: transposase [Rhodococcus]|uniref:Transposase n=1 Tax=Rhodococcus parequi TaxID=3137122 RepID=A0ABW9FAI6_9NOCA
MATRRTPPASIGSCCVAAESVRSSFEPSDQAGHRRRRGSRGGRPPAFDSTDYRGRNVVERRFCHLKQWRGLATRYDKLAIVYRSAIVLHAVIAWTRRLSDMP